MRFQMRHLYWTLTSPSFEVCCSPWSCVAPWSDQSPARRCSPALSACSPYHKMCQVTLKILIINKKYWNTLSKLKYKYNSYWKCLYCFCENLAQFKCSVSFLSMYSMSSNDNKHINAKMKCIVSYRLHAVFSVQTTLLCCSWNRHKPRPLRIPSLAEPTRKRFHRSLSIRGYVRFGDGYNEQTSYERRSTVMK